jgi:hypothetical protein
MISLSTLISFIGFALPSDAIVAIVNLQRREGEYENGREVARGEEAMSGERRLSALLGCVRFQHWN